MAFTEEDKKALFDRLGKIEIALTDIKGRLRGTDKDVGTLNARGCEHGVRRYEDLSKQIRKSEENTHKLLERGFRQYRLIGGVAGIVGMLGGYFIKTIS